MKKSLLDFLGTNPSEDEISLWYNRLSQPERDELDSLYLELLKFMGDVIALIAETVVPTIQTLQDWWQETSSAFSEVIKDFEEKQ